MVPYASRHRADPDKWQLIWWILTTLNSSHLWLLKPSVLDFCRNVDVRKATIRRIATYVNSEFVRVKNDLKVVTLNSDVVNFLHKTILSNER